jgi:hypothetical protein
VKSSNFTCYTSPRIVLQSLLGGGGGGCFGDSKFTMFNRALLGKWCYGVTLVREKLCGNW